MLGCKLPDYRVNRAEALRYLGYAGQALDAEMEARIDENIAACEREARPGFVFRSFPIETCERGVRLAGSSLVLEGVDIARHLKGAAECAVLACTLGVANEAGMARRKAQSALDAAIYGAAGSSLVESVTDACEATVVADAAKRGMRTNWRYSPGYGDLPLALQPEIVRVLAADKRLGMVATESNLLIPAKSVTAFVGPVRCRCEARRGFGREGELRWVRLQAELHAARRRHALLEAVAYRSLPPSHNWEHIPRRAHSSVMLMTGGILLLSGQSLHLEFERERLVDSSEFIGVFAFA